MNIEFRHLKWAVVASQHRSLRRAAETLNIRQSTLSRCLRDLEHLIGPELFDRTTGGTQPTPIGREFLGTAQRLLEEVDSAFSRLRTHRRGEKGELRIGIHAPLSAGNLRATLIEHRARFEGVELLFIDGLKDRLLGDVLANVLDVAFVTAVHPPQWPERILPLWSERVIVALPEQHALREHATLDWRQIKDERILLTQRSRPC
jgi:DNA-binding transcriptional LysR family regulator